MTSQRSTLDVLPVDESFARPVPEADLQSAAAALPARGFAYGARSVIGKILICGREVFPGRASVVLVRQPIGF
ncbi:hypothetical protein OG389_00725 [Streptomyces sp. NBC_00435]|uniref:hypothetical protein n=1 Tax=Streptomyces sp. NBC_00435 TaxID=2903649 RepID=UPI002E245762